jgi:hypothetical protein
MGVSMGLAIDDSGVRFVDAMVMVPASYITVQRHGQEVARLRDRQRPRTAGVTGSNPNDSRRHYEAAIIQSTKR